MNPNPHRQPVFNIPVAVLAVLVALIAVHAVRQGLSEVADADLLARFAFVPGRFTYGWDPARVVTGLMGLNSTDPQVVQRAEIHAFFLGDGSLQPWTVLTYGVLHGDWMHLGLNAVWLLAFGTPIARRFGAFRFVVFLAACAVAGALAHYLLFPVDLQPVIGASAAVSGCMGAALRFMFQPPRLAAEPWGEPAGPGRDVQRPKLPILAMLRDRRALTFLVVWFLTNLVSGIAAAPLGITDAPVAWQAHVGGFLLGLFAFAVFDPPIQRQPPEGPAELPETGQDGL